jgi:hypothetical protein
MFLAALLGSCVFLTGSLIDQDLPPNIDKV